MTDWFDSHHSYILINGSQYPVLLDDKEDPSEMWSTILFQIGDTLITDGSKPQLQIVSRVRVSDCFEVRKYRLALA